MDKWDKQMLERDKRLTGSSSHQSVRIFPFFKH
jgi:hypothetical protein